jgi:hypothetical protein
MTPPTPTPPDDGFLEFTNSEFRERRSDPSSQTYYLLFRQMADKIEELSHDIKDVKAKVNLNHATYMEHTERAVTTALNAAFPEGDPEGHRKHHEIVIERESERLAFWKKMREEVGKWGITGVLGLIGLAVWKFLLGGPVK